MLQLMGIKMIGFSQQNFIEKNKLNNEELDIATWLKKFELYIIINKH